MRGFCPKGVLSQRRFVPDGFCPRRFQGFMQDENVACHDIGKLSFERAVGCFGTPQLERATRFPNVPS